MINNSTKRIAFFGTPQFTVAFLELFKDLGFDIVVVVTGEDKPVGRGMQMKSPGPKIWGDTNNIQVLQPKKLDEEFYTALKNLDIDLSIVIAYGKIIPEKIIALPKFGTINLHYSLLPKWRGASPVESAILNGDEVTGITIQQMTYQLDAGNILYQEEMKINGDDTTSSLRERLNSRAKEIFPEFLENFFSSSPFFQLKKFSLPFFQLKKFSLQRRGTAQDEKAATKCGKFLKDDLDVTEEIKNRDWDSLYKKYKAFDRKIFFFKNNLRIKITEMNDHEILKLLPESKKEISIKDFENSYGKIF